MKTVYFVLIIGLVTISVNTSWESVQLDATMPINGDAIVPRYVFSKTFTFDYPDGGDLKDALDGKNLTISFSESSSNNPTIKSFVQKLNTEIADNRKSPVTITDMTVNYQVILQGNNKQATLDYNIALLPTMTGYVLNRGIDNEPSTFDASWAGFDVQDPVVILPKNSYEIEINYPINLVKGVLPNVYNIIHETSAEKLLDSNLIDASHLYDTPIDRWDSLYDPSYTYTPPFALQGSKIAVTTFSHIPSFQSGQVPKMTSVDFTADKKYSLSVVEKVNVGTINVQGHATATFVQGVPAFTTFQESYTGCPGCLTSNQLLFSSILIMTIGGGAVIGFWVFYFRRFRE